MRKIKESFYFDHLSQEDQDKIYAEFKASYEKETGAAWSEGKFLSRAKSWTFYGTVKGGVAVRKQKSGLIKMVACYGLPLTVARALKEMMAEEAGHGIWGAMTKDLAIMMEKFSHGEFKMAPGIFVKMLVPFIKNIFGDEIKKVQFDGGIIMEVEGIGTFTKYMIANKAYYRWLLDNGADQLNIPDNVKAMILPLLKKLV